MSLKKLEIYDAAYFRGKNYFDVNDGTQNYLVFQHVKKYLVTATITLNRGNQKDCLMKKIVLLQDLNTQF